MTSNPRESREQLTRERIVRTALEIVDREGLAALSMRRLGAELGVDPMAVYHYLQSKDALLDAIVEAVMSEIDLGIDDPAAPTEERVLCAARTYRDVLFAHAGAMPILLDRSPSTPAGLRPVEALVGILRDAGLPPSQAVAGMNAISATVRGTVSMIAGRPIAPLTPDEIAAFAEQLPAREFPNLREAALFPPDVDADFEFGIRALARGLVASVGGQ
jgi:TetR/AcrR family tetracycline transcriptional repressor